MNVQFSGRVTKSKEECSEGSIWRPSPWEPALEPSDTRETGNPDCKEDSLQIASDSSPHSQQGDCSSPRLLHSTSDSCESKKASKSGTYC